MSQAKTLEEALRREHPDYQGLSDSEVAAVFFRLHECPTRALIRALEDRGITVELHLFDRRYREDR